MTRDEIIEMARQAGFEIGESDHSESIFNPHTTEEQRLNAELERFAAIVAAKEREDILRMSESQFFKTQAEYDDAIRARE